MSTPDHPLCQTCKNFDEDASVCRRYPPATDNTWPVTIPTNWCGEWADRLSTLPEDSQPSIHTPYRKAETL